MKYAFLLFVRNLQRQKLFSTINLLGLTVSIVSTLIIYAYVSNELSFDRFHVNADRIYRINQTFIWGEGDNHQFASTGPGVAHALKEELPELEMVTSIFTPGNFLVSRTNAKNEVVAFDEDKILAADSNFFSMFNFPLVQGNEHEALVKANTLVLTESTAKKYFANENALGQLIRLGAGDQQKTYEVTGVVKDLPNNSYIQFDFLLSNESFPAIERMRWSWIWTQLETYVLFKEKTDIAQTEKKLALIPRKHAEQTIQRAMNMSFDDYLKTGKKWELFLQPLTSIHLPSEIVYNRINNKVGNLKILYSLIGAGFFIVVLSCINFMNLSTAQFTRRVKEASIRKILGLNRSELRFNFFFEAFLFITIALGVGLGLMPMALSFFNWMTESHLSLHVLQDQRLMMALAALVLIMSFASGAYPAIFLSSFNPVEAIKGKLRTGKQGSRFRNGLVVFQFAISIALILCTSIVFQQLNYFSNKDIGFNKENLVVLKGVEYAHDGETLMNAATNIPGVEAASLCTSVPPRLWGGDKFTAEGLNDETFSLNYTSADEHFIPAMGITIAFGKNFQVNNPGDYNKVLLNEAALKRIGWEANESSIGKRIQIPGTEVMFEVAGVVKDFNYWTLQTPIEPMAIFHHKNPEMQGAGSKRYVVLRVASQNSESWKLTLSSLSALWKQQAGDLPFQYEFVDDAFADTFKTEQQFGMTLIVMATLTILIACLGLLGMIVYSLEQRTKEIGIRKVSGASVANILVLISKGYTRLIILAFVISAPLSYWVMEQWLADFAFRVSPSPLLFAMVGLGTLTVAILITSYHSVKASLQNPVDVLRDE